MGRTATSKKRTARPPHKPLEAFPMSPHPPVYVAISCNLANYNPQPGDDTPECIDMGVAVFRGETPMWTDERAEATLPQLMSRATCYHVINSKYRKVREDAGHDKDVLLKYPTLYMGLYAESRVLDEDAMGDWLWTLLLKTSESHTDDDVWSSDAKSLAAFQQQCHMANGTSHTRRRKAASSQSHLYQAYRSRRNLVIMDWAASGTDGMLRKWGIADKLRIREDKRVQFWDLRQWNRVKKLVAAAPPRPDPYAPPANPRDFTAALEALAIGHRLGEDPYGLRNRDIRGNAGNDAYLKLAIFLSVFTMTNGEETLLMMTGRPLSRGDSPIELKRDAEILKANQQLDWKVHPQAEFEPYQPVPADRMKPKREEEQQQQQQPKKEKESVVAAEAPSLPKFVSLWDIMTPQPPKAAPNLEEEQEKKRDSAVLENLNTEWDSKLTLDMAPLVPMKK